MAETYLANLTASPQVLLWLEEDLEASQVLARQEGEAWLRQAASTAQALEGGWGRVAALLADRATGVDSSLGTRRDLGEGGVIEARGEVGIPSCLSPSTLPCSLFGIERVSIYWL